VPEGVVHALKKLHTALRPQGVLLDVHPLPQDSWFEVRRAGQNFAVGQVDQAQDIADITSAEAALGQVLAGGRFVLEGERSFTFVRHFDSVETWLAFRAERQSTGSIAEEALDRARALLAEAPGELCVHRVIRAARYRKG
jgi:hypothetical protein